jgi:hypothetical protein
MNRQERHQAEKGKEKYDNEKHESDKPHVGPIY